MEKKHENIKIYTLEIKKNNERERERDREEKNWNYFIVDNNTSRSLSVLSQGNTPKRYLKTKRKEKKIIIRNIVKIRNILYLQLRK